MVSCMTSLTGTMVRLQNAYANANDTIKLFSIQMQMSMHLVIVITIVIMTDYRKICHDNNRIVCVSVSVHITQPQLLSKSHNHLLVYIQQCILHMTCI